MNNPLTPTDPPGSHFDGWAVPTPEGEWNYELADFGIYYGPGWWPFHRYSYAARLAPASIRVSPDTAYQSWRNEYILLWPSKRHPARVDARITLFVRTQGLGAIVADTTVTLDLKQRTATVAETCPTPLREQAETKATRLLQFVQDHRRARRGGITAPDTAYARWIRRTQHRDATA